ncbi:hypothetical protein [Pinirhizobacter soli]|uniref:hypothetical protein n=1 Tax=Pinirhizobacter soli TaxID=2786953 RepID=UPI00202A63EF|nr:hypothetical protein [Pinirhizobacter soli]
MSLSPVQNSIPVPVIMTPITPSNATTAGQNMAAPTNVDNVAGHRPKHEDQTHSPVKPEVSAAAAATQDEPEV